MRAVERRDREQVEDEQAPVDDGPREQHVYDFNTGVRAVEEIEKVQNSPQENEQEANRQIRQWSSDSYQYFVPVLVL